MMTPLQRRVAVATLALGGFLTGSAPATALSWSNPESVSSHALNGIACPSAGFCVAVGDGGSTVVSTAPASGAGAWHAADVDGTNKLLSVSCASASLCLATDNQSRVLASIDPAGAAATWGAALIDPGRRLTAISCPSARVCVAVDRRGGVLSTKNPRGGAHAWKRVQASPVSLTSVSCASARICVATESGGNVLVSTAPTGGARAWRAAPAFRPPGGFPELRGVSCPDVHFCAAAGIAVTDVFAVRSLHPMAGRRWFATNVDSQPHVGNLHSAISCGSSSLCVLIDGSVFGTASVFASKDAGRTWRTESLPNPDPNANPYLSGVACSGSSLCVIVDHSGNVTVGH